MKKNQPQFLRDAQAARRKAEITSGIRSDSRFVSRFIPDKRRKKASEIERRELRDRTVYC